MAKDRYEISLWEDYSVDTILHNVTVCYAATSRRLNLFDPISGEKIKTLNSGSYVYFKLDQIEKLLTDYPEPPSEHNDNFKSTFLVEYRNADTIPYKTYRIGWYYWGLQTVSNQRHFMIWSQKNPEIAMFDINIDDVGENATVRTLENYWIGEHYEERKIAVIGSDSMTTYCRAVNPQLVENINGTNTLTFTMYYTYIDENGIKQQNPFIRDLLVNERKVKALWKDRWYDFIIKSCIEDSGGKSITYTCQDLFINELSKTGYNIELSAELNNNQGQAHELAARVLAQTDWTMVGPEGHPYYYDADTDEVIAGEEVIAGLESDLIQQKSEEPVYRVEVGAGFDSPSGFSACNQTLKAIEPSPIAVNQVIYVFYNQVQNAIKDVINYEPAAGEPEYATGTITLQFLYNEDTSPVVNPGTCVINNLDCWTTVANRPWKYYYTDKIFTIGSSIYINIDAVSKYRGDRLVLSPKTEYDPLTNQYCDVFIAGDASDGIDAGDVIYRYTETEWHTPSTVNNIIINSSNFSNTSGWQFHQMSIDSVPQFNNQEDWDGYSVLQVKPVEAAGKKYIYNTALKESRNYLPNGMTKGEKYVFRYKIHANSNNAPVDARSIGNYLIPRIHAYRLNEDGYPVPQVDEDGTPQHGYKNYATNYIKYEYNPIGYVEQIDADEEWNVGIITCRKSFSYNDILDAPNFNYTTGVLGLGLFFQTKNNYDVWLEDVQIYPLVYGKDENDEKVRIDPGKLDTTSISQIYYVYYNHTKTKDLLDKGDIKYLYRGTVDWPNAGADTGDEDDPTPPIPYPEHMTQQLNDNFEKIRAINAKQSNRFNIIQSIAETFQCWARFIINHDINGRIIYEEDGTPQKYLIFKQEIGQETGISFVYGIDLNTIKRTIQSNQIVTKTIVNPNANEFATNGFCTIARSELNPPRTSFILNFEYYTTHNMLDENILHSDLYDSTNPIGYYPNMYVLNTSYDKTAEELVDLYKELTEAQADYTNTDDQLTALTQERSELRVELAERVGYKEWCDDAWAEVQKQAAKDSTLNSKMRVYIADKNKIKDLQTERAAAKNHLTTVENAIKEREEGKNGQKELLAKIHALDLKFYNKYSRFIQEGAWQDEQYIDDNLYYLDAQSVAYTSSRPQVQYDISVLRLSSLDEYKYKIFRLGDIGFIQDTEFFGYADSECTTPYKEQVLVSEITSYFDEPDKDTLKIQNYKTQFEDLFQRITATTQSLQYASGEYSKVASIIQPDGTIKGDILQNSIAVNEQLVYASTNDLVEQDSTGITVTDKTNPNHKTKITSGGLFITIDGGQTWKNAVRGEGIATQYLTAGKVNVNDIIVYDGEAPTFRWDGQGINAYYYTTNSSGEVVLVDRNKFVRFDKFGIYGINQTGASEDYVPLNYTQIKQDGQFGMTWDGFFMKSTNPSAPGYVEISNENAIKVVAIDNNTEYERIKIGAYDGHYGIQISNNDGPVMETADDGSLWLREKLSIANQSDEYDVQIGHISDSDVHQATPTSPSASLIFSANDNFKVYADGHIIAQSGEFHGDIASGATITGATITGGTVNGTTINGSTINVSSTTDPSNPKLYATLDSNGINVYNNGLTIWDTSTEPSDMVFGYTEDGLYVKGNGEFTGKITAESGEIGGWIIEEVEKTDPESQQTYTYEQLRSRAEDSTGEPLITLDGTNGSIYATNIELGEGATIENYIQLGKAQLHSPSGEDHRVLTVFDDNNSSTIELLDSGILNIGSIVLNGTTSTISGGGENGYRITPERADFYNINAAGKITTAVFEYNKIQSVGGAMLFKPTFKIASYTRTDGEINSVTIEEPFGNTDNYNDNFFMFVNKDGKLEQTIHKITNISDSVISFEPSFKGAEDLSSIVILGINGSGISPFSIGINSNDGSDGEFLKPRGITMNEFTITESQQDDETIYTATPSTKVFIGQLTNLGIDYSTALSGYGLYSDNVYLNGKLIADNGIYSAGIDTRSDKPSTKVSTSSDPVILWAGAQSYADIGAANFHVTRDGYLYARQGRFEGGIYTDATIKAGRIETAKIYGAGPNDTAAALGIYDTTQGIIFYNGSPDDNNTSELLKINNNGLTAFGNRQIIALSTENNINTVGFVGNTVTIGQGSNNLLITDNQIAYKTTTMGTESIGTYINFNDNMLGLGANSISVIDLSDELITFKKTGRFNDKLLLGEKMSYKQDGDYYDLYIE